MRSLICLFVMLSILTGCSSRDSKAPALFPVTGNLKIDGKPLEGIIVQLMPADMNSGAQPCSGTTDKDGNFKIATNGDRGATAGKFKVVLATDQVQQQSGPVSVEEAAKLSGAGIKFKGMPKKVYPFPQVWASPLTTPKTIDVKEEANTLNIDI